MATTSAVPAGLLIFAGINPSVKTPGYFRFSNFPPNANPTVRLEFFSAIAVFQFFYFWNAVIYFSVKLRLT
jgi:hypothetical protein